MNKIKEILNKYIFSIDNFHNLPKSCHLDHYELAMKEYAEWYAMKCLELAAENAIIEREYLGYRETLIKPDFAKYFLDSDIMAGDYAYKIERSSIKNILLPEHE